MENTYTTRQVAKTFKRDVSNVLRAIKSGKVKAKKLKRGYVISEAEFNTIKSVGWTKCLKMK